jgi:energy-coupling factor transporter transmembrane protein EcfT
LPAPNHANPWFNHLQLVARFASMLACMLVPIAGLHWPWPFVALIAVGCVVTAAHEPAGARRRFLFACASNLGAGFLIAAFVHKPLMQAALAGTVPVMFMGLLQLDPPKVSSL